MPFHGEKGMPRTAGPVRTPGAGSHRDGRSRGVLGGVDLSCLAGDSVLEHAVTVLGYRFADWGLSDERRYPDLQADARLVLDELVVNACRATPDRQIAIRVDLAVAERCLCFAVWDTSPEAPKVTPVVELAIEDLDLSPENFDCNGGRGLHLVTELCNGDVGVRWTERPFGKWVWARLRLPAPFY